MLVVDAAHDAAPIVDAVGDRRVVAIVCTHGHNDHINAADDLAPRRTRTCAGADPRSRPPALGRDLSRAARPTRRCVTVTNCRSRAATLRVLHTPGHSPGGVCLLLPDGHVFGGDTLFRGGPGATGRSGSDFPTIIESIRTRLLDAAARRPSCTPATATPRPIGDEAPHLDEWIARGH